MEVGDKLKELSMTADEVERLTKAFKDGKFREMLNDYAREISDPENRKRYEEEITLLEQQRGNTAEFIHPEPFRSLRTSVDGRQKCFINICANEKIGKPESKWGVSEEGRRGQCWSLPHSLHPGRQDKDPKGNKIMIYDVIFHPDTLHIASKNKRFMDMVVSTALQGVQDAFKVTLDKNNVREMRAKYKGTPQPCIVRKPIPGYKPSEEKPDPLAFPYPDDKKPSPHTKESTKSSSDAKPKSLQVRPQSAKEPTEPNYTVKYRSFIDLQDFRCSRDSTKSPRPKEIVVTIDVPLLKAVSDASLEVREEKLLLLESRDPAYRLELPLAYPVDEDAGEAKFNKQRGQLMVTLPVLPSREAFDFAAGAAGSGDGETQEEKSEAEEEDEWRERNEQETEQRGVEEEDLKRQTRVEKDEEIGLERGEEQVRESQEGEVGEREKLGKQKREEENSNKEEEEVGVGEEAKQKEQIRDRESGEEGKLNEQRLENETQVGKADVQKCLEDEGISESSGDGHDGAGEEKDSAATSFQCDAADRCLSAEEEGGNSCVASPETENQPVLIAAECLDCTVQEREENLNSCLEQTPKITPVNIKEETESENGSEKVETDATSHHRSSEEAQSSVAVSSVMPAPDEPIRGDISDNRDSLLLSEGLAAGSVKPVEKERTQGDDLWMQRIKPPPVLLREIDKDGNETVISDHSTSVELVFLNTLIYELD